MTLIEDRLRAAARAAAAAVPSDGAPPLRLPAAPRGRAAVRGASLRRRPGWLVPVAVGTAGMAAGAVVAIGAIGGGTAPRPDGAAVAAYPAAGNGLPSLFISPITAQIYSTVTGRLVATPALPGVARRVAAGADDRTFYAEVTRPCPHRPGGQPGTGPASRSPGAKIACPASVAGPGTFYKISVGAGRAVVSKLPIRPATADVDAISPSPDGSRLAIANYPHSGGMGRDRTITVASATTGTARTWTTSQPGGIGGRISWLADGHTLAFTWSGAGAARHGAAGHGAALRLLDIAGSGGNLLAGPVVMAADNPAGVFKPLLVSPDGRTVIGTETGGTGTAVWQHRRHVVPGKSGAGRLVNGRPVTQGSVVAFSARTGQAVRIVIGASRGRSACQAVWTDPAGSRVLAACDAGRAGIRMFVAGPGTSLRPLTWATSHAPWLAVSPGDIGGAAASLAAGL